VQRKQSSGGGRLDPGAEQLSPVARDPARLHDLRALEAAIVQQQVTDAQPIDTAGTYAGGSPVRGRGMERLPHMARKERRITPATCRRNRGREAAGIERWCRHDHAVLRHRDSCGHDQQASCQFAAIHRCAGVCTAPVLFIHQMAVAHDQQRARSLLECVCGGRLQRRGVESLQLRRCAGQAAAVATRDQHATDGRDL